MQKHVIKPALALMVVVALMVSSAQAQSAVASEKPAKTKPKKKTVKVAVTGQSSTVKFMPGSQESTQERNRRLMRECKGGVNAGACEGYTR